LQTSKGRDRAILNSKALRGCSCSCRLQITNKVQDRAILRNRALRGCKTRDLCAKGTLETRARLALLAKTLQK